ncbi:MAG TPA: hypothetical protein DGG94_04175 [Micromonosporaceae bacterium]|nr:hypothetical protein [Micromonosporaceae bacterium]HCU48996.1 hypothetical protein [Micromonosporaceae bacterium]
MRKIGALLGLLFLLASCTAAPNQDTDPPAGSEQLALRIQEFPGLMPPGVKFAVPKVSLYGTGRMILDVPGSSAMPAPIERSLSPQGIRKVLQAAADAGLLSRREYGTPRVGDAGVTIVTLVSGAEQYVSRIVGLGVIEDESLTAEERAAREKVRAFVARFADLDKWLAGDLVGQSRPYSHKLLAVYALPQEPVTAAGRQWPLADLATAGDINDFGRCQILSGDQMRDVTAAAATATRQEFWRSGEGIFHVAFRPLLPDEKDCTSL